MKKTINVSLDIKRVTAQPSAIPPLVAGDTGNSFVITLTDAGSPVDLSGHKVVAVFSKVSDGTTVEQDTEDAVVSLSAIGINLIGTPSSEDTITVTETAQQVTAETTVSLATVTVDADLFRASYPNVDEYVFEYNGTAWQYGENSVKISGTSHNIITIDPVKSGSYGNGKNNCELQIFNGSQLITSAQFSFDGRAAISNDRTIQAQEKFPVLVQMIKRIEGIEHGTGFMLTETYDPNGDGKVISAESADTATNAAKLGTHDPSYYATAESVSSITPESIGAAVPATSVTVSIGTDGWSTSGEGYEKTVSVSGVTSTANVIVTPAPDSFTAWTDAVIRAKTIGSGSITFYAESVPESSVTANVMVAQRGSGTIGGTGGVVVNGVQDVKVNGQSVVTDGVATVPIACTGTYGIVKLTDSSSGLYVASNGNMYVCPSNETEISRRCQHYKPIASDTIDYAVKSAITAPIGTAGVVDGVYQYPSYTSEEMARARARIGAKESYELIADIVNEENDIIDINVSVDSLGNQFSLKKLYVIAYSEQEVNIGSSVYLGINNSSYSFFVNGGQNFVLEYDLSTNFCFLTYRNAGSSRNATVSNRFIRYIEQDSITYVKLHSDASAGNRLISGLKFKVYGVRA